MEKTISISGMNCNHCKAAVEGALSELAGVSSVSVDLEGGKAVIACDNVADDAIRAAIDDAGFDVTGIQ